ncbi:uncharacterized protein [Halyomorpha halys]|uniref:uncharacterized protein n=1 Tax=Halyomorpha halys TaxID=286706 RepID=UPI0006D52156
MSDSSEDEDWPVSSDWLTRVLTDFHQGPVTVDSYRLAQAESALSDILFVSVVYRPPGSSGSQTKDLVLKLLPRDPFSRFFVSEAQFDLREIKFYTKVAPELHEHQLSYLTSSQQAIRLDIPLLYHALYSGGEDSPIESILVLENLKSEGYDTVDFAQGLSLEQAQAAISSVAKLHALSLLMKVREGVPLDRKYPFLFQTARATDSYQQLVERGLPQLNDFLQGCPGLEPVMEALAALKPDTKEIISGLLAPREPLSLITHTDFWCNNLLFDKEDRCCILDWQMVTYSRPTNDIALLMVSSLATETRRSQSTTLLDHYWAELTACCRRVSLDIEVELGYTRNDLSLDFRRSQLLALLLCIGSVDVALGNPVTEHRLVSLLQDLHSEGILSTEMIF